MPTPDPQAAREFALEVVQTLRSHGFQALWAGGCVRDALLGQVPKDYDVATNASPDEIREAFGRRRTLAIGAAFGVITVLGRKPAGQIEVATFRRDSSYSDGRHPDGVIFTDAREDALRRDFTINGLFWDPIEEEVIDYVGGREDLAAGQIRAIGVADERFAEDKLRMLRAVRFTSVYDFELESATFEAITRSAATLSVVSAERISDEFRRMLKHSSRARAVRLLQETGLLRVVLPEIKGTNFDTLDSMLAELPEPSFSGAFAILLREFEGGAEVIEQTLRRWKLSNEERSEILFCLQHEPLIRDAPAAPWPRLQPVLTDSRVLVLLNYVEAIAKTLDASTTAVTYCRQKLTLPADELNPEPLISGNDLKALGVPAGPAYRRILQHVRDAQLNGELRHKEDALASAQAAWAEEG